MATVGITKRMLNPNHTYSCNAGYSRRDPNRWGVLTMDRIMFVGALILCAIHAASPASAQTNLDRCDDILRQSLFNTVTSSSQESSSEQAAYTEYIFSLDATKAYAEYDKAYKSGMTQGTTGSGEGHYGIVGGAFAFTHSYDRQLSKSEFAEKFSEAKAEYQRNASSSSSRDTSLISFYQSSARDATLVKAWEHCMTTKYPEPGLFAYGYRDASGHPYVVVMWSPGTFAAANPVINVKFAVPEPGMTVEGAAGETQVATGSGVAFPVTFRNPSDRKAIADGFAVLVNGELKSGDRLIQSFRSEATVPRNLGPLPCSLVFSENQAYELGVFDTKRGAMNWGTAQISTMGQRPPGPQQGLSYTGRVTQLTVRGQPSAPIVVTVSGTGVVISEGDTDKIFLTGQCTGQGVRARTANSPFARNIEFSIRPR